MHTETILYQATAPGAGGAAAAAATGDSLIIKNNRGGGEPSIIAAWSFAQTAGFHQIVFPTGHDTTRNFRFGTEPADTSNRIVRGMEIPVTAQEQLSITIAGSAVAGDVESGVLLVHYPNLPGIDSRTITFAQLQSRAQKLTTVFATITGAAAGYTGGELINAESDLLLANRDYALMGMSSTIDCVGMTIIGPDTGNVRIACPGADIDLERSTEWFCDLSRTQGKSLIPVINSGNKNATTIGIMQDENNVSPTITLYLALLAK